MNAVVGFASHLDFGEDDTAIERPVTKMVIKHLPDTDSSRDRDR